MDIYTARTVLEPRSLIWNPLIDTDVDRVTVVPSLDYRCPELDTSCPADQPAMAVARGDGLAVTTTAYTI
ncbi:hypothetical protein GCM10010166_57040 [Couchioplanes caeruleus subsp. azureus]|nr:hypothetical protein GCM10010166_57040 [Couchioplanes caeruleus subsp. azureus]